MWQGNEEPAHYMEFAYISLSTLGGQAKRARAHSHPYEDQEGSARRLQSLSKQKETIQSRLANFETPGSPPKETRGLAQYRHL